MHNILKVIPKEFDKALVMIDSRYKSSAYKNGFRRVVHGFKILRK